MKVYITELQFQGKDNFEAMTDHVYKSEASAVANISTQGVTRIEQEPANGYVSFWKLNNGIGIARIREVEIKD